MSEKDKKIYITTPIYYVNDIPHIGHAYTTIAADILARYYKAQGKEVFFMTGTDEHGAKIAEAAEKQSQEPKDFVDELVPKFKNAWKKLNIDYDAFFRTTDPKHELAVQEFVLKLEEAGFIEKRKYEGQYCVGCEKYITPDELTEEGLCPDHGKAPICQSEENYFFLLSKLSDKLLKAIESKEFIIGPDSRRNEVLGKIKQGLEDVSISRQAVEWGIPYPTDSDQTIYVWIDALLNYYTAETVFDQKIWPADLHLMAKDILWFHAVIWPAMLLALDLPLPKKVFAHGFFTINGKKMSKTLGNVIDPIEMAEKYGADAVRYALFREFPFGEDGDISEEKIALRYQNDLANGLGNLLNRTLSMICKYELCDRISSIQDPKLYEIRGTTHISDKGSIATDKYYADYMEQLNFSEYLIDVWAFYIKLCNNEIDDRKPWELAKNGETEELFKVLSFCYINLCKIITLITPFMPETAEKMQKQLETLIPEPMFPRIEK